MPPHHPLSAASSSSPSPSSSSSSSSFSCTQPALDRRQFLAASSALLVAFSLTDAHAQQRLTPTLKPGKTLKTDAVDAFLSLDAKGHVTVYCGKVDLGTGLRIAIPQMVAEELCVPLSVITLIEGDTALTPDQGPTAGSSGIMRGGVQIRQAAATAREALLRLGADHLHQPRENLSAENGYVTTSKGGPRVSYARLLQAKPFALAVDDKAPLKNPTTYKIVGQPLPRPDIAAKVTGRHPYMHDVKVEGMMHARVLRPAAIGATLLSVDETSIAALPEVRIVRLKNFLAVVSTQEWSAIKASQLLKTTWSDPATLPTHQGVKAWMRQTEASGQETLVKKGNSQAILAAKESVQSATYYWPLQSHASMGPSCGLADVRADGATIWSASQATHRLRGVCARLLDLPIDQVRVIYRDGSGCYGTNGHDDVCADAALISKAIGRPVRVQWSRADELGWDPKGPPQLLTLRGCLTPTGRIEAWETQMWLPKATASLPNIPLLGPQDAGIAQPQGLSTGLITQNAHPPYAHEHLSVNVHWLKDSPLRPSNIRAPGKIANSFAVESFVDELAARGGRDALALRLEGLSDPRGLAVCRKVADLMQWQTRPSPAPSGTIGRGFSYVHYKFNETYVAIGMEVDVNRAKASLTIKRIVCAHDCGLMINPDATRQQVEGNILQTLSRTLFEETQFDRSKVTSVDWQSYPLLTFPDVPPLEIALINQPHLPPLGAGEAACAAVPAALANAIFDACGARLREVPFTPARLQAALKEKSSQS